MICVQCIFHLIIKWKCLRGVSSSSIMGMLSCWFPGQVFTKLTLCQLFSDYTLPMFCDFLLSSMVCVSDRRWLSTLSKCHLILPNPPNTLLIRPSETQLLFDQDHEMNQPCRTMSMKSVTFILVILANNIFCTNTNTLLLIFQNCSERHLKSIPCLNDCKQYGQIINNICNLQTNLKSPS